MSFVDTGDAGKSIMTQKIDTKLHFGAKKFLAELKDSESVWSLMVDASDSRNLLKSKRICPIFVFALKNLGDPCLVDGRAISATHSDGTVVISGSSSMLIIFTQFMMHLTHTFYFVL
jgi:hypothetical protein